VQEELGDRIPLILDGGPCHHGIESTILLVRDNAIRILRQGPVTRQDLEPFASITDDGPSVAAPGTMKSHYAPRTRMTLAEDFPAIPSGPRYGLLAWASPGDGFASVERLSATLNLREAAANLYAAMRRLDGRKLDGIVAEFPPPEGLGLAIRERLLKACAEH
jgi:L-threonylcarbamoyladenylate synthase